MVVPTTVPANPTSTQGPTTTTSAGPVQTSDLGCLKDTTEDPHHMYFYRRDATVLIPGWCNATGSDRTEDHDIGGWDATETQPVARAGPPEVRNFGYGWALPQVLLYQMPRRLTGKPPVKPY
jgi:hypothetical protein